MARNYRLLDENLLMPANAISFPTTHKARLIAASLALHCSTVLAEAADSSVLVAESVEKVPLEPLSYGNAFSVIFSLLVVLAVLFACAWVLRRGRGVIGVSTQKIAVTSQLSLGVKEKILLLRVGDENILVGYAGNNLRTLHSWQGDAPPDIENAQVGTGFADYLSQLTTGRGGKR
ncbi:FliO/MopB family protein [Litorivivens sp.]|uniref:FliO/MopB family protein n=1 Tax=Litorivivens sp. TaxID=2020868 RepID=UPI003563197D